MNKRQRIALLVCTTLNAISLLSKELLWLRCIGIVGGFTLIIALRDKEKKSN